MIKNVLIVDDDPIFHFIISKIIEKIDPTVNISTHLNGKLAVEYLLKKYNESDSFIALLDINMPVMSGWKVLEELQSSKLDLQQNLSLYMVSSSTNKGDLEKAKQYGIVRKFYHKPLNQTDIQEILNS